MKRRNGSACLSVRRLRSKVPAGALSLVLVISLLISSMLGSLVMLAYYRDINIARTSLKERLRANAASGIHLLLASSNTAYMEQVTELDLFGKGDDSVRVAKQAWGVFDVYIVQAVQGRHTASSIALVGVDPKEFRGQALYLPDEERPLSLSGNTEIIGDCYLPKAGVKAAYVNQTGFLGEKLVEGVVRESAKAVPAADPIFVKRVIDYCRRNTTHSPSFNRVFMDAPGEQYIYADNENNYSFNGEVQVIRSKQSIHLTSHRLTGKVLVMSDQEITVSKTAFLQDIIVAAPTVRVEDGFSGSIQIFATDSIIVGKSRLLYPSALCMQTQGKHSRLLLKDGAEVSGLVYMGGTGERLYDLISIEKGAVVTGMVYADGLTELKGSIAGSLTSRRLFFKTPTATYENHLIDATIHANRLPASFLVSPLLSSSQSKGIVKWVR